MKLYGTRRPPVRKKEVSFTLGTGEEYITSNCTGRAVRQFEKEISFILGTGEEYIISNCMGRTVCQFEKEVSFKLRKGEVLSN